MRAACDPRDPDELQEHSARDGAEIRAVSFWVTGASADGILDPGEYHWPRVSFGTMSVRVSRLGDGLLRIELDGAALDDRGLAFVFDCPTPELAPNGRLGVLIDLSWQPRGVRLSVQNELLAEHRFALH
jgi:hypothetical protein